MLQVARHAIRRSHLSRLASLLLMALEGLRSGQQGPATFLAKPKNPRTMGHNCLEHKLSLDDAVRLGGVTTKGEGRGLDLVERRRKHLADGIAALHGLHVPGEGYQVAPKTIGNEKLLATFDILLSQRLCKLLEPSRCTLCGA